MAIRVCALILSLATAAGAQDTTKKAISIEDLYRTDGPRTQATAPKSFGGVSDPGTVG